MARQTVIGKHALILVARGETEIASQIFVYDHIREVRVDLKNLEVKVLMNYDDAFFRVFSIKPQSDSEEHAKHAQQVVLKFYNDLVNASIKLTPEEAKHLKEQQEAAKAKAQEAMANSEEDKKEPS
jgi:hypothetical protein